ncbi:MAG TPA: hypothetical protein VM143_17080 [Acidimicrobiales bacterium]|nr:hypothetical protein [Acidimicrobiales bacterium]
MQDELGTCENCAREDSEVAPVKRMYVVPESWDQHGSSTTMDEVERWCWSCRTQYPHVEVE